MLIMERLLAGSEWQATERSAEIGDCLVWTGSCHTFGHGLISIDGRTRYVHRIAWIERHGELPIDKPWVLHRCDNPPCWRDDHLFSGTRADNMADMASKGRSRGSKKTHCPRGHPYDEVNTYVTHQGKRNCRACRGEASRRAFQKKATCK